MGSTYFHQIFTECVSNQYFSHQINSYVPIYVDVEKPAGKSVPFQVYLYENVGRVVNITLPIHFRYHDPSNKKYMNFILSKYSYY